jgi:thiosulfate dehydrogenase
VRYLRSYWFISLLAAGLLLVIVVELFIKHSPKKSFVPNKQKEKPLVPDANEFSNSEEVNLIRYGRELITHTSKYFGPKGSIASITNGLNCQNCHLEGGTKLFTNNFLGVASTYPKFRERSGKLESVEFRINECLQRSLNGDEIDSLSKEMRAMVAYIKWTGKGVDKKIKRDEIKTKEIPFLERAADPSKGALVYAIKCKSCHGENGQGLKNPDSLSYVYPPLWGPHSYAMSAGMYRITKLASFVKFNMPLGATYKNPQLTNEEAWDVAAYVNSMPHPEKKFVHDWPVLGAKPVDYPFGPYADKFSEKEHKYGPFLTIQEAKKK